MGRDPDRPLSRLFDSDLVGMCSEFYIVPLHQLRLAHHDCTQCFTRYYTLNQCLFEHCCSYFVVSMCCLGDRLPLLWLYIIAFWGLDLD